ncbi:MAG: hypothetical protein H0V73_12015 [Chloroflexi bacterium]|nr:hypothetical protein [Chloroflexota bacterium]
MIAGAEVRRLVVGLIVVALVGATMFGLWHLVVGGLVNGNVRAAAFGAALAGVSGGVLAGLVILRRSRRA